VSNEISVKSMVIRGRCQLCGQPIKIAKWVADNLDKQGIEVEACSRKHANVLAGAESSEYLEAEEGEL
jgi:hypothetical protein